MYLIHGLGSNVTLGQEWTLRDVSFSYPVCNL
jgi:hypothetical protein